MWLRSASFAYAFFALAHAAGMLAPSAGPAEDQVVAVMREFRFVSMGLGRSIWSFYWGFAWLLVATLLVLSALLWIVAERSQREGRADRPIVATLLAGAVVIAAFSWAYLFPAPGIVSTLAVVFLAAALRTA